MQLVTVQSMNVLSVLGVKHQIISARIALDVSCVQRKNGLRFMAKREMIRMNISLFVFRVIVNMMMGIPPGEPKVKEVDVRMGARYCLSKMLLNAKHVQQQARV